MRSKLLAIPLLATIAFAILAPAISQDETYHSFDQAIYAALPLSGHTLKHLLAAAATFWILRWPTLR